MSAELLALVRINEMAPMFATADIAWPGEQFGEWSLDVEGDVTELSAIYFAQEFVSVRFVVFRARGLAVMCGKALPVSLTKPDDLHTKATLRLAGNGDLEVEDVREDL